MYGLGVVKNANRKGIIFEQYSREGRDQFLKEQRKTVDSGFLKFCEFSVAFSAAKTAYMVLKCMRRRN